MTKLIEVSKQTQITFIRSCKRTHAGPEIENWESSNTILGSAIQLAIWAIVRKSRLQCDKSIEQILYSAEKNDFYLQNKIMIPQCKEENHNGNWRSRFNQELKFHSISWAVPSPRNENFNIRNETGKLQIAAAAAAAAVWGFCFRFHDNFSCVGFASFSCFYLSLLARCQSQSQFWFNLLIVLMTMLNAETFEWINCVTIWTNNCFWCACDEFIRVAFSTWQ